MPKITKHPGIRKIELKGGGFVWELRIAKKGSAPYTKRFNTKKEAEAARNINLARVAEGKSPINRKAEKLTIADAIQDYLDFNTRKDENNKPIIINEKPDLLIPKTEYYRLNMLDDDIGEFTMSTLKSEFIDKYIAEKLQETVPEPQNKKKPHPLYDGDTPRLRSGATVRKLYYTLKKIAKWHSKKHEYPLPDLAFEEQNVPPAWGNERERRLEQGEEEMILSAIEQSKIKKKNEWRRLILWALESGMRAQELLKTRWVDINLEHHFLNIRKEMVKTKTARQVPLSDKAIAILNEHKIETKREDDDRIFWQWKDSNVLGHGFKVITTKAGLSQRLTIHDLRHEATSRLFENTDLSAMEISAITGHQDLKTLKRYTHLRPELLASKMNGKRGKQVEVPVDDYLAYLKWERENKAKLELEVELLKVKRELEKSKKMKQGSRIK